jgi:hypothetical protein
MSGYKTIHDPEFDRAITLRDAYRAMELFVREYYEIGDTPVIDFLAYLTIANDGISSDPAAIEDFLSVVEKIRSAGEANI